MGTDDSELTHPLGTPKPAPFVGMLPSTPPPVPEEKIKINKLARQQKQLLGLFRSFYPDESSPFHRTGMHARCFSTTLSTRRISSPWKLKETQNSFSGFPSGMQY